MKYCPACQTPYPDSERFCPTEGRLLSFPDPYHLVGRTLLEKYRVDALIGLGGMGAVYSAYHLTINRHVAVKILQPNLALGNERLLELFQREAEIAGQLSHENIVDIKDAGRTPDNLAYIVMEWLEGRTLEKEIEKDRQLSFERIVEIFRQVAAALDHAHARRIIHRDLKPANIMLVRGPDGSEQVKVVDFGIAKVVAESNTPGASSISLLLGTPHYASPEQFSVGSSLDSRSDIYSLGVLLYQMLCGRLPFTAQSLPELIRLQRTTPPPAIRQRRPETPEAVEQLLFRMLDQEPQHRPPSALEAFNLFVQALNGAGQGRELDLMTTSSGAAFRSVKGRAVEGATVSDTVPNQNAATDKKPLEPTAAAPRRVVLPQTVPGQQTAPDKAADQHAKTYLIVGMLLLAVLAGLSALYLGRIRVRQSDNTAEPLPNATPASGKGAELMRYYLEVSSDECQTLARATGDESLSATQFFKFHFLPQRSGYLYILAQNERNVPMTFLTAQPDAETGVNTNFVEAGSDYGFPSDDGKCLGLTPDETMMAFTVILSSKPLTVPEFLAAPALHELTATEQHQFNDWRLQQNPPAPRLQPDAVQRLIRVTLADETALADKPLIFDLPIKRR